MDRTKFAEYEEIQKLLSHEKSYKMYRKHLRSLLLPCLPYFGVFLTDLTFTFDGNPDTIDGLVHFGKFDKIASLILKLQWFKVRYDNLVPNPAILSYLDADLLEIVDENGSYSHLLRCHFAKHYSFSFLSLPFFSSLVSFFLFPLFSFLCHSHVISR